MRQPHGTGDLCYVNALGKHVPLVQGYRANPWYALKIVAEPRSGLAEIAVNGKRLEPAAEFSPPGKPFDGVQFRPAGNGLMWVDDVRVYLRSAFAQLADQLIPGSAAANPQLSRSPLPP